ncbi:MAG TPA: hypothetical protein VM451_02740 [Candidatus Limnocylindria bacterium]|nr:hypothetical protein [Candidatus Limnocylindria bacterium]
MIERLLAADAALERDELAVAERLFGQVAQADERNAIAVVGLGRVALRRGDRNGAAERMRAALAIDPEEAAARRLLDELEAPAPATTPGPVTTPEPVALEPPAFERPPSLLDRIRRWLGLGRGR